jgi:subtilisin family serine protease
MVMVGPILCLAFAAQAFAGTGSSMVQVKPPTSMAGQIMVSYRAGLAATQRIQAQQAAGVARVLQRIDVGSTRFFLCSVAPGQTVGHAVAALRADPKVISAQPNYLYHADFTPNDALFPLQWGLNNTGQTILGVPGTADADIDAREAWDVERGSGMYRSVAVNVAVIDSGIDASHPDLASRVWTNVHEISGNGLDDDANGYIDDVHGYNFAGISQYFSDSWSRLGLWNPTSTTTSLQCLAQTITGTGEKLTSVGFLLQKVGSPTHAITITVRSYLQGSALGPVLASATIAPSEVSTASGWLVKSLSAPVTLTSGLRYYIELWTAGDSTGSYFRAYANSSQFTSYQPDVYRDGNALIWNGVRWVNLPFDDLSFQTNANANPRDDNGHGTHVSGIIAGTQNNTTGISGVAPGVKIMPLKAGGASRTLTSPAIVAAITYAANNGARVINMSFSDPGIDGAVQTAVNYAYSKNVVLFASSGNSGDSTISYPANDAHVIGVGATNNKDQRASFSSYNASVDVSAPGQAIMSTMPSYPVSINSEGSLENYDYLDGTSMASPMAAGVGALILARAPGLTALQVEQNIEKYAEDKGAVGRDDQFGSGRLNAYRSLNALGPKGVFTLNNGATTTTSPNVTATNSITGATFMRFAQKAGSPAAYKWSAWVPYTATSSLTLTNTGTQTVLAQYHDAVWAITQYSYTITLQ